MATSPTVLRSTTSAASSTPASARFPVVPLLVAVLVGALIAATGLGGGVYYLASTGRLSRFSSPALKAQSSVKLSTHMIVLAPLLVNLADSDGNSYLRVSIALKVADATDLKAAKQEVADDASGSNSVAAVRDTALIVLGRQTSGKLLATDGKEHLKAELKEAFTEHNPDMKIVDIFFTDFLVQR